VATGLRKAGHWSRLLAAVGDPALSGAFGWSAARLATGGPDRLAEDAHLEEVLVDGRERRLLRRTDTALHGRIYLRIGTAGVLGPQPEERALGPGALEAAVLVRRLVVIDVVADQLQVAVRRRVGFAPLIDLLQVLGIQILSKGGSLVALVGLVLDRAEPFAMLAGGGILVAHLAALAGASIIVAPVVAANHDQDPRDLCSVQTHLRGDHSAWISLLSPISEFREASAEKVGLKMLTGDVKI